MDADAAWAEAQPEIERSARRGTWLKDTFFTGPDESGRWCHIAEIRWAAAACCFSRYTALQQH